MLQNQLDFIESIYGLILFTGNKKGSNNDGTENLLLSYLILVGNNFTT